MRISTIIFSLVFVRIYTWSCVSHPSERSSADEVSDNETRPTITLSLLFIALQFPGLVANCTIDWFLRWPRDALVAVADHFLSSFNIVCTEAIHKELVQCMGSVHDGVAEYCSQYFQKYRRATHVTPKSYLSFINGYKEIYTQKLNEIESKAKRMNDGLRRLVEAEKAVISMKEQLTVTEKELDVANRTADAVLQTVAVKKGAAEIVKQKVLKVKDTAQKLVDDINRDRLQANAELEKAKPALLVSDSFL